MDKYINENADPQIAAHLREHAKYYFVKQTKESNNEELFNVGSIIDIGSITK